MKTKFLLAFLLLTSLVVTHAQTVPVAKPDPIPANPYTLSPVIQQSTMHDAIQYYYAKKGFTFYFRQTRTSVGGQTFQDYEVIDLVNNKNLGSLKNFAGDLQVTVDPVTQTFSNRTLMDSFLTKYNGRFEYVMTKITQTKDDLTIPMCRQILRRILRRNANSGDFTAAYAGNTFFDIKKDTALSVYVNSADQETKKANKLVATGKTKTEVEKLVDQIESVSNSSFADLGGGSSLAGNVAQGTAKFLIERANQEINAAFFRRLKKTMDETQELQKLFPEVYKLTSKIESYNFDAALNALKTKLEEDLENLLANIPTLAEIDTYKDKLNQIPELTYFFAICDIMNGLKSKQNAGGIIHTVYISPYVQSPSTNEANILKFSGLLSFSLRDAMLCDANTNEKGWIVPSDLSYSPSVLLEIFQYYIGFLAQSDPGIVFRFPDKREVSLKKFLFGKRDNLKDISGFISDTYESLQIINEEIVAISLLSEHETSLELVDESKFAHYKNICIEFVNITDRTVKFPNLFTAEDRAKILKVTADFKAVYIPAAEKVLFIVSDVEKKNYNEAVFNTGELINLFLIKAGNKDAAELAGKIFKYGQFFASVATAENGDDVKNAINTIALPSGSSSLKKDLAWNIAVNGYIGYFRRHIKKSDAFVSGFTQSYGITAPVGFTFSAGARKGGSFSLFTGIIDVGAIAQYQLKTDQTSGTTTAEPDIEWGNIISPSLQFVYGAPCYLPLSVGFGAQWMANNAKLSDDAYKLEPRFNIFLAFDIPIVNLLSVKRKGK